MLRAIGRASPRPNQKNQPKPEPSIPSKTADRRPRISSIQSHDVKDQYPSPNPIHRPRDKSTPPRPPPLYSNHRSRLSRVVERAYTAHTKSRQTLFAGLAAFSSDDRIKHRRRAKTADKARTLHPATTAHVANFLMLRRGSPAPRARLPLTAGSAGSIRSPPPARPRSRTPPDRPAASTNSIPGATAPVPAAAGA